MIRCYTQQEPNGEEFRRLLELHRVLYGKQVVQTHLYGDKTMWESSGHTTEREAEEAVWDMAISDGWTAPKWWQFWRWSDSKQPKKEGL